MGVVPGMLSARRDEALTTRDESAQMRDGMRTLVDQLNAAKTHAMDSAQQMNALESETNGITKLVHLIGRIRSQTIAVAGESRDNSVEMEQLAHEAESARLRLLSLIELANTSSSALGDAAILSEIELANLEELEIS